MQLLESWTEYAFFASENQYVLLVESATLVRVSFECQTKFTVRLEETKILFLHDISNFTSFLDFSDQDLQIWMLGKRPNCDGCEGSVQHVSESPFSFSTFDFWRD
jgi:hypothetical protein